VHVWASRLELDLRRGLGDRPALAQVEKIALGKAEGGGEQHRGKALGLGVELGDGVVEEPAGGRELVLDVAQLTLQLQEVLVGLEVGIGFGDREQAAERAGQRVSAATLPSTLLAEAAAPRAAVTSSSVPRSWAA
jgi:hypothetical protein